MSLMTALRDLNKLNTFVLVAERLSFTKAAADLRTTPSVVSNRMKELEELLGFSIMNRSTHGIVLTEAGEGLYRNCLEALEKIDAYIVGERNLHSGPYGMLRIRVATGLAQRVLEPLVVEFSHRCPDLRIHLSVAEEGSESLEDGFDVIVAAKKPNSPGLVGQELGAIPHVVCASPEYLQRHGWPKQPRDLLQHNCLVNPFAQLKQWPFTRGRRVQHVAVKGSLSSNLDEVLVRMAVQGCGVIRMPLPLVKGELESKTLNKLFDSNPMPPDRISVYYSKAKILPAKTTDFIGFVRTSLSF